MNALAFGEVDAEMRCFDAVVSVVSFSGSITLRYKESDNGRENGKEAPTGKSDRMMIIRG